MKPQADFPKLEEFKKAFKITEKTIFAYDGVIYCNYDLTDDLIVHETTHHKQQERDGLDYWTEHYLNDPQYRLSQEIEAYKAQIQSIKDKNHQTKIKLQSAKTLASDLYGNLVTYQEALQLL